ncbi:MAG: hypothetical protein NTX52_11065, partial [Planctomycetota bacterium]|nr:hypothetical protein [Planctomycetota bacterium]
MKDEYILGISCLYHDSAASIIKNDKIVAAAQEERFTRKKFDDKFPDHAIAYCLAEAGIGINDVTYFGFYEKPLIKFERILETYLDIVPRGARTFTKAIPLWMKEKLWIPEMIKKKTGYKGKIIFLQHHLSHAASSYLCSPFDEAAIITFDAVGEWTTTAYGVGQGNDIRLIKEIKFPNSLGMFYSAFTYYLGFKVDSGEYKVMGAAPYGKPTYYDLIKDEMIKIHDDGSFRLNLKYFGFLDSEKMINKNFEELFEAPARGKSEMNEKYFDIANSVQKVTEEIMMNAANYVREETGMKNLCLAGGTALNSVANGRILKECGYDDVYIQPAAGDAGGALGTSMYIYYKILNHNKGKSTIFETPYLGPAYSDEQIENVLSRYEAVYKKMEYWDLLKKTARLISERNVVAWFQGRFEWGPRALGNRSILADPRYEEMKEELNSKIKFRES